MLYELGENERGALIDLQKLECIEELENFFDSGNIIKHYFRYQINGQLHFSPKYTSGQIDELIKIRNNLIKRWKKFRTEGV